MIFTMSSIVSLSLMVLFVQQPPSPVSPCSLPRPLQHSRGKGGSTAGVMLTTHTHTHTHAHTHTHTLTHSLTHSLTTHALTYATARFVGVLHNANELRGGHVAASGVMEALSPVPGDDASRSQQQLDETDFVNDGINNVFRVGPDFEVWKQDMLRSWGADIHHPRHAFTLCDYPYLLSLPNKTKILTTENLVMHERESQQHVQRNIFSILQVRLDCG